jgi:hypothetical protein
VDVEVPDDAEHLGVGRARGDCARTEHKPEQGVRGMAYRSWR